VKDAHPGKRVEVWQQDEARIGQQGTLTRVWGERGSRPSAVRQSEYEWAYLFAAVNPLTGASSALIAPTVNTQYMNRHLAFIGREAGPGVHVVLVLDQAGWHVAKALKVPSGMQSGIKVLLGEPVTADAGELTIVTVDFDVDDNFVLQGPADAPHGVIFTPVLKEKGRTETPIP